MAQWIARITAMLFIALPVSAASADWQVERAQTIAAKVWNDPCAGSVSIAYDVPPDPSWAGWAQPWNCSVTLSSTRRFTWMPLCSLMIHEYGHLAGFRDPTNVAEPSHSADPDSIMYAYVHTNPMCKDYGAAMLGSWPQQAPAGQVGDPQFAQRKAPATAACAKRAAMSRNQKRKRRHRGSCRARSRRWHR